jgi:hypothetical protein
LHQERVQDVALPGRRSVAFGHVQVQIRITRRGGHA